MNKKYHDREKLKCNKPNRSDLKDALKSKCSKQKECKITISDILEESCSQNDLKVNEFEIFV